ncbi:MAG: MFS transporter [Candidatus Hadarchaeales archaeon]
MRRLLAAMFMMSLAMGATGLALPIYAGEIGATYTEIGLIGVTYVIFDAIFSIPAGILGDRKGCKGVLILGFFLTSAVMATYSLARTISTILMLRLIQGATEAPIWTNAQAAIAGLSKSERRGEAIGLFGASWGIGFGVGPALGGFLYATIGPNLTFFFSGLLALVASAILLATPLPAPVLSKRRPPISSLLPMCFSAVVYVGILAIIYTILPVYAYAKFNLSEFQVGVLITIFSTLRGILFIPLGKLSDRVSPRAVVFAGIVGAALASAAIAFAPNVETLAAALLGLGVAEGATYPAVASKISKTGGTGNYGYVLGVFNAIAMVGWGVFPGLGGALADLSGPSAPFLMCFAFGVVSAFLLLPFLKK